MGSHLIKYALPIFAVAMLAFGYLHSLRSQPTAEKLTPPALPVRSPYNTTVAAAGLVEARNENIAIGVAVAGVVLEVFVPSADVGKFVKKGTPLFKVDDRHLQAQLRAQQANLASIQAQLAKLEAMPRAEERPPSQAKAQAAEANYKLAKDQADRAATLMQKRAISPEDYTQRQMALEVARFQMQQAKADYALLDAGAWRADKDVSLAAVELARAQVEQRQTEIERTIVRAPVDGHVLQVNVRPGEYVGTQPGQALMMLGDLTTYHVRVDIDEHDIPRFRPHTGAKASPRGHSAHELKLNFVRVERYVTPKKSLTGDNTERVDTRVLQVIYAIDRTEVPIFVGQQLDVFIETKGDSQGPGDSKTLIQRP